MTSETVLILKLCGKLIDEIRNKSTNNVTKGKLPPDVRRKVDSYNITMHPWSMADGDILALVAVAELMWERGIAALDRKDENALQMEFGVNSLSKEATRLALSRMQEATKQVEGMRAQCEAMPALAKVIAGKSLLGGPANASQIAFDKMAAERVAKQCKTNLDALDRILRRLKAVTSVTEETVRVHQTMTRR